MKLKLNFLGLGPILPQIAVFGRQLGVSATVMGFLLAFLPFLYFFAKPAVGILADYFSVNLLFLKNSSKLSLPLNRKQES